ncbi:hypothetical protein AADR41_25940 [Streptomyces sp. CLV115]|uniref:hypothetical protein n=1 Tax=Streptomyces sp. CLV115 TaxID=3138502 RepID=UPI00313B8955
MPLAGPQPTCSHPHTAAYPPAGAGKRKGPRAPGGILPPALLRWFSGLNCYVILDGHPRLVAAIAENREPTVLVLSRAPSGDRTKTGTDKALSTFHLTMSIPDGPHPVTDRQGSARAASHLLATRLHKLKVDHAPTRAWPMPAAHRPGLGPPLT